ncbi:hypothetical protein V6N13_102889 [Hibiscus sabdariffa]|uniref:Auxin-responsive protein SAUR23-like n=1 Tax=Hibiscus sabdariffa TaxID=183260 RepID=A0ABR2D6A4_9ROSI
MVIHLPSVILHAKQVLKLQSRHQTDVPRGHIAVYVGKIQKTRFVIPISYLNHPYFLDLLDRAKEEFGFNHPMGGLTIPCDEDVFIDLTSRLHGC